MSALRCVVFDFDGTLVDSNTVKHDAFLRIAARFPGGEAAMRGLLGRVQGDRHAVMAAFVQTGTAAATAAELVQAYSDHVDAAVAAAPAMPGAEALLQALHLHGLHVVLSSATPLANLRGIVERRGWSHHFHQLGGSPASKVETLGGVMAARGLRPDEIAVVGDGADDRASAVATGCAFFAVGEARGTPAGETVYPLPALQQALLSRTQPRTTPA